MFTAWRISGRRKTRTRFLYACIWMVSIITCIAISPARAQQAELQKGIALFQNAEFEKASEVLSELAKNQDLDKAIRKDALRYLGQVYIALQMTDEARKAIAALLELEPPLVELDPDVTPPPLMDIYFNVRKEMEGNYEIERPDPGMQTIAIMDFTNSSIYEYERYAPLQFGLSSMMIHNMAGATELKVVERERIQWLIDELNLQKDASLVDQSSAVRMGKMLGATSVLFGSYNVMSRRQMWLGARLVKVETGEILLSEQITGNPEDLAELLQKLSLQVAQAINVTLEETNLGMRTETRSLDALMSYSEGLGLLEQQEYRAAYEKFLEALNFDPKYERARLKAESIRHLVG